MKIVVTESFDLDAVAARFPGLLTFRGAPASSLGATEIEGDVNEAELVAVLAECGVEPTVRLSVPAAPAAVPPARWHAPVAGFVAGLVSSGVLNLLA